MGSSLIDILGRNASGSFNWTAILLFFKFDQGVAARTLQEFLIYDQDLVDGYRTCLSLLISISLRAGTVTVVVLTRSMILSNMATSRYLCA